MRLPEAAPGGVLAFDLARQTGWAYAVPGGRPVSGELEYPPASQWGRQIAAHAQTAWAMVDAYAPAVIAYEAPLRLAHDREENIRTAWGLAAQTEAVAFGANARPMPATPSTIRAKIFGDGAIPKQHTKAVAERWCRERGWGPIIGHNQADALIVLAWALRAAGLAGPFTATPWNGVRWWRAESLLV